MNSTHRDLVASLKATNRGKHVREFSYYHRSLIEADRASLTLFELLLSVRQASNISFNVLKLSQWRERFSLLEYASFEESLFPELVRSTTFSEDGRSRRQDFSESVNPPILHRKELLLNADHPSVDNAVHLTRLLESLGLFSGRGAIGTLRGWERKLSDKGLSLKNNTLTKQ